MHQTGEKMKRGKQSSTRSEMTTVRWPTLSITTHMDVGTYVYFPLVIRFNSVKTEVNFVHLIFFLFHVNNCTKT